MNPKMNMKLYPIEDPKDFIEADMSDFDLEIECDVNDLIVYTNQKEPVDEPCIFSLIISKKGCQDVTKIMFATMTINDLELFGKSVNSLVKQVRKNYKKQLAWQYAQGGKP